jgi:hypothetical protein
MTAPLVLAGAARAQASMFVLVLLGYPALGPGSGRAVLRALILLGLLASPTWVPLGHPLSGWSRFGMAIVAGLLLLKLYDLGPRGERPTLRLYLMFMAHPFHLVYDSWGREPGPGTVANLRRLLRGLLECAVGAALLAWVRDLELWRTSFWLHHAALWLAVYPILDGSVVAQVAGWRLLGGSGRDIFRDPIAAHSPADFWRRYNRLVGEWLHRHVFQPAGGIQRPRRAVFLSFVVSALIHEALIVVITGGPTGHMTAFFLLQGLGAALTLRFRPRGARRVLAAAVHLVFLLATLVFFATAMDQAVTRPAHPLYPRGTPVEWPRGAL